MKAIIHAGMSKTGSSSIQGTLARLDMPNHVYAPWKGASHNQLCALLFLNEPEKYVSFAVEGVSVETLAKQKKIHKEKLIAASRRKDKEHVIISAEALNTEEIISNCASFVRQHFSETRLIVYARPPISFMQSAFQQRLKYGSLKKLKLKTLFPSYRKLVENLDQNFGRENIELYKFSFKEFPGGDVVQHFCQINGIEMTPDKSLRQNDSVPLWAAAFLFLMQKFGDGTHFGYQGARKRNENFLSVLSEVGNTKIRFSSKFLEPIFDPKADELEWIEGRFGQSLRDPDSDSEIAISHERDFLTIVRQNTKALNALLEKKLAGRSVSDSGGSEVHLENLTNFKPKQVPAIIAKLEIIKALC